MFTGTLPDYNFFRGNVYTATGGESTIPVQINPENIVIRNGVVLSPQANYVRDPLTSMIDLIDPATAVAGDMFYVLNLSTFHVSDSYTKTEMDSRLIPCGAIMAFAYGTPDPGWLECSGSLQDQATYPTLFGKIGHAFRKVRTEIDCYLPLNGNGLDLASYRDKSIFAGTGTSYVSATGAFGATQMFQGSTTGGMRIKLGSSFSRSAFTIEGYWKAGTGTGTLRHIFSLGDTWGSLSGFNLSVFTDNKIYCYLNSTNGLGSSTVTLSDQNLHHIAVSYDGTTYKVFLDGELVISVAGGLISSTFNGELALNWQYGYTTSNYKQASQYSNWLVTSGLAKYTTAFTPSATAPDIYEVIPTGKFRLPDLRGESLRGWDHGRGIDSFALRPIGSWQEDSFQGHYHEVLGSANVVSYTSTGTVTTNTAGSTVMASVAGSPISDGQHGGPRVDSETRPRNVAVMFCIKAADLVSDPAVITASAIDARTTILENNRSSYTFRNKIINGKMEIAQRGTSFAAVGANTYTLDRWKTGNSVSSAVLAISQQVDAPSGSEFVNSLRVAVTTADTSIAVGDNVLISQIIEGFNVRDLIGKTFTVSFWVRSSKTGTHCTSLSNSGLDRSYVAEYTINSANTWEYKSFTVIGGIPSSGTWDFNNGNGLSLRFSLAAGTTFQVAPGVWQTGNFIATSNQVNCLDTVGNIFAITGVQLEAGSTPTNFEHRSMAVELSICQRYYEKSYPMSVVPGTNVGVDTTGWPGMTVWGSGVSTASQYGTTHFRSTKRVTPTIVTYCGTGVSAKLSSSAGQVAGTVGVNGENGFWASSVTAATWNACHWTADAEL